MFVAAAIKELRKDVLPTMVSLVRHCTMVSIAQTAGGFCTFLVLCLQGIFKILRHISAIICNVFSFNLTGPSGTPESGVGVTNVNGWGREGMDAMVLLDALAVIMGHEEKELCKPGRLALVLILQTAINILGSKERVSYKNLWCY